MASETEAVAAEETISVEVEGIPVTIDRSALSDDMETLELLADIDDGDLLSIVRLMRHVFGDEQYRNIKRSLRKDGRTSLTDMNAFLTGVFAAIGGDEAKN